MQWWDEIWLNEGFATFMEFLTLDAVHPNWQYVSVCVAYLGIHVVRLQMDQFYLEEVSASLRMDSMHNSHPIVYTTDLNSSDAIGAVFDPIAYNKACVPRLCNHLLLVHVNRPHRSYECATA
jgi:aminopeptidase N